MDEIKILIAGRSVTLEEIERNVALQDIILEDPVLRAEYLSVSSEEIQSSFYSDVVLVEEGFVEIRRLPRERGVERQFGTAQQFLASQTGDTNDPEAHYDYDNGVCSAEALPLREELYAERQEIVFEEGPTFVYVREEKKVVVVAPEELKEAPGRTEEEKLAQVVGRKVQELRAEHVVAEVTETTEPASAGAEPEVASAPAAALSVVEEPSHVSSVSERLIAGGVVAASFSPTNVDLIDQAELLAVLSPIKSLTYGSSTTTVAPTFLLSAIEYVDGVKSFAANLSPISSDVQSVLTVAWVDNHITDIARQLDDRTVVLNRSDEPAVACLLEYVGERIAGGSGPFAAAFGEFRFVERTTEQGDTVFVGYPVKGALPLPQNALASAVLPTMGEIRSGTGRDHVKALSGSPRDRSARDGDQPKDQRDQNPRDNPELAEALN